MSSRQKIIFRADGNSQIGLGHLVRCSALAEMLKEDFNCTLYTNSISDNLKHQLLQSFSSVCTLPGVLNISEDAVFLSSVAGSKDIVVLDGYIFNSAYQKKIKQIGCYLICIDDLHQSVFFADTIINHCGDTKPCEYTTAAETQFLLGTDYSLLRSPFIKAAQKKRNINELNSVFINFGGSDPKNHTMYVVNFVLEHNLFKTINVVTGSEYKFTNELTDIIKAGHLKKINHFNDLSAQDMCRVMSDSHVAICPSSTVSMEACSVGMILFTGYFVENQKVIYEYYIRNKLAIGLSTFTDLGKINEYNQFKYVIDNQRKIFYGQSAQNLKAVFLKISKSIYEL